MRRAQSTCCTQGEEREKNNACVHTSVQAVPTFIYERGYPIGYLASHDPQMFSEEENFEDSWKTIPNYLLDKFGGLNFLLRCNYDKKFLGRINLQIGRASCRERV